MSRPEIVFYVARADNGVIGRNGTLPWRIPGELARFKAMTMGKPMVMGRRTFESLPGLLPGRRHIVLTRSTDWAAKGADVAHDVEGVIALAGDVPELAVIGGAEIFRLFEPHADRVELTEVHGAVEGDTIMPPFDPEAWREQSRERRDGHSYVSLVRR